MVGFASLSATLHTEHAASPHRQPESHQHNAETDQLRDRRHDAEREIVV